MRVVGVDQSYTGFGYCVDGESKKKSFPIPKDAKVMDQVVRLIKIRAWFEDWLDRVKEQGEVDLVVMEGYANAAKFGREQAGELGGVVKLAIKDVLGLTPLVVPPTSLKKFVSGSGVAKKNTMLMQVYRQWGAQFSDDNQADAYALEKFGMAYLDLQQDEAVWDYHKYQIEAVEAVRKVT